MIPYEQLAAVLERRVPASAATSTAVAAVEDNTLSDAPAALPAEPDSAEPAEYDIGDVLSDEDAS